MSSSSESSPSTVAIEFLTVFLQDREDGRKRTLEEYQAMFPHAEAVIAREYDAVMAPGAATRDAALEAVSRADRYEEIEVVARGGMGTVHRVRDSALGRLVAMKLLGDGKGSTTLPAPEALSRFLHEARITARLQHPSIVPVLDLGVDAQQRPYYTMPLIAGENLAAWIRGNDVADPRCLARGVAILERVSDAMAHAHSRHVIHRDLKPANVMLDHDGAVYVVDWGVARARDDEHEAVHPDRAGTNGRVDASRQRSTGSAIFAGVRTQAGDVVGTPAYMAPEQARGEAVDERSDVYALGAILYHLLTRRPPYAGQADTATPELVRQGPPTALAICARTAPPALAAICERAMARTAADRYPTAREFAAELRAFLDNRVVQAYATGPVAELFTWTRRNRGLAAASLLTVAALVAGIGVSLQQKFAADANANLAEQNLEMAFAAAEGLLVEFGEHTLANDPAADPLRRALADRALAYYRRFTELRGDDPRVHELVARSHFRIGLLEARLGQNERSTAALERAHEAYSALARALPDVPAIRNWLARVETEQQIHTLRRGALDEAAAGFRAIIGRAEEALAAIPATADREETEIELLHTIACAKHNLGLALIRKRQPEAALSVAKEKVAIGQRLVARQPDSPLAQHRLATGQLQVASVLRDLERFESADAVLAAASKRIGPIVEAIDNRGLRTVLAEIENLRGTILRQLRRPTDAIAAFERAIAVQQRLVAANPNVLDHQTHLAGSLCNLGVMRLGRRQIEEAHDLMQRALEHIRRALAIDPNAPVARDYRRIIAREFNNVGFALALYDDIARQTLEFVGEQPDEHDWFAAYALAGCTTLAARDATLSDAERSEKVGTYGDATMRHLEAAKASNTLQPGRLGHETFAGLRDREDFLEFLAELGR